MDAGALRSLAEAAARAGGALSRAAFGQRQRVSIKPDSSEVTEIDVAAERAVIEHIRAVRPADRFIGEEGVHAAQPPPTVPPAAPAAVASVVASAAHATAPPAVTEIEARSGSRPGNQPLHRADDDQRRNRPLPVVWVIDPIDGTRNFIRGVPTFSCSVAALHDGRPVAAAIYDPMADVLYAAAAGRGATANGAPLDCGASAAAERGGQRIVGIPSAWRAERGRFVQEILSRAVVRSLGSATHHLVYIASGGIDATFMNNCKLWDIAAGALIVEEAGGIVTDPAGRPHFPVDTANFEAREMPTLAGTPVAHAELLRLMRST